LESKFIPEPNTGCFLWFGTTASHGYGKIKIYHNGKQKAFLAHRLYYELEKGPIPKNMVLDHLCRVRCCVNPEHLEIVTLVENIMRGEGLHAREARRTHCPQGHEYAGENLFYYNGKRLCRTCSRIKTLQNYYTNHNRYLEIRRKQRQAKRGNR